MSPIVNRIPRFACAAAILSTALSARAALQSPAPQPATEDEVRALPTELSRWTGDFDVMIERRAVRVLVPYSRPLYFNDKGRERGITAEAVRDFEAYIGPKSPAIKTADDLAGRTVHVRKSSSYHESLVALSDRLRKAGRHAVNLVFVPDVLADEDMMEMLNQGLLEVIVVDDWKARMWAQVLRCTCLNVSAVPVPSRHPPAPSSLPPSLPNLTDRPRRQSGFAPGLRSSW